ncbi:MAG: hypothetical protein S4CHLAM2_11570 [Chlamydiales bacterium]|nr:hypothetical protein [Chlamydiales bacterium]
MFSKSVALFSLFCLVVTPAFGFEYVIRKGEMATTPITLAEEGDEAVVEEGGSLTTSTTAIVMMVDLEQRTSNLGSILTTGVGAFGVQSTGGSAQIFNAGSIVTQADTSDAIRIEATRATIINRGIVSTQGDNANGLSSTAFRTHVFNSGSIFTEGNAADGFFLNEGDAIVSHSGLISVSGTGSIGIRMEGANSILTNSGSVRSNQAAAIRLGGFNSTLNLLKGSNIQGAVTTVSPLALGVETGLNLALTLGSGSYGTLVISAPFVQVGAVLGVVDPTGLAMQADVLADVSDTVLGSIYRHRLGGCCDPCGCGMWVQGVGSYRHRDALSRTVAYDNWQSGFLIGDSLPFGAGYAGFFGGATFGQATVTKTTQKACLHNYVVGATYEGCVCNTYFGVALALGYLDWVNHRYVQNNLAPGGVEDARANSDAFFISPEITLVHAFERWWCHPVLSCTLRYAGGFFGCYTESGSLTNLTVRNRTVDLITTRFEAAVPYVLSCCWDLEPYIGVLGRYQVGGFHINGELLGQSLNFDQGGPENLAAFLVGFRSEVCCSCFDLFGNFEASFDSDCSSRYLGEVGIGYSF